MKKKLLSIKQAIVSRLNKWLPDPTPAQTLRNDAEMVGQFVADKANMEKAIVVADGIYKDFQHAFEVKHLVKKYNTEPNAVVAQLQMLSLFKLCSSSINSKGKTVFRITLTREDRLKVLYSRFEELAHEKAQVAMEIKELETK